MDIVRNLLLNLRKAENLVGDQRLGYLVNSK